jgi:uncharacterized membrane protein
MPTTVLAIGLVLNALMAGLYFGFSTAVMPALARTEDRNYVTSMQRIDESILNPRFLTTFMGALVVPIVAVFLHLGDDGRDRLPWIVAGAVLYGATIVITGAVNIPLNKQLRAAGDVTDRSAPAVRAAFHHRWTRFNTARTALCTAAVVALTVALARPMT